MARDVRRAGEGGPHAPSIKLPREAEQMLCSSSRSSIRKASDSREPALRCDVGLMRPTRPRLYPPPGAAAGTIERAMANVMASTSKAAGHRQTI